MWSWFSFWFLPAAFRRPSPSSRDRVSRRRDSYIGRIAYAGGRLNSGGHARQVNGFLWPKGPEFNSPARRARYRREINGGLKGRDPLIAPLQGVSHSCDGPGPASRAMGFSRLWRSCRPYLDAHARRGLLENGRGGAGFHPELVVDARHVMMHRAGADAQNDADLWIAFALTHPVENFVLPRRQRDQ